MDSSGVDASLISHSGLANLSADDHTQYILADGSRAFSGDQSFGGNDISSIGTATITTGSFSTAAVSSSLSVSGTPVNINNDHGNLSGLSDDDHSQYILVDGTRAFTGKISGVSPTASTHLAIKKYVDTQAASLAAIDKSIVADATSHITVTSGTNKVTIGDDGDLTSYTEFITFSGYTDSQHINKDGSVTYESNQDFGGNDIIDVGNLTADTGAFTSSLTISGSAVITAASAGAYTTQSFTNVESVQVVHNGNNMYPIVQCYDENGHLFAPQDVYPDSLDSVTIYFASPKTGTAAVAANFTVVSGGGSGGGVTDHGALTGLADDDHTQYIRADGTRAFTGSQSFGNKNITSVNTLTATNINATKTTSTTVTGTTGQFAGQISGQSATFSNSLTANGKVTVNRSGDFSDECLSITLDSSNATQNAVAVSNDTNYAQSGDLISFSLLNAADSGDVVKINNSGAGKDISGTSDNWNVDSDGTISGTSVNIGESASAQTGSFSTNLTVSGTPVMINGLHGVTVSGSSTESSGPVLDFVGSRGLNVSKSGNTITFDTPDETGVTDVGISNVAEDTTPQLGGNLDVNGYYIGNAAGTSRISLPAIGTSTVSGTSNLEIIGVNLSLDSTNALGTISLMSKTIQLNGGASGSVTVGGGNSSETVTIDGSGTSGGVSIDGSGTSGGVSIAGGSEGVSITATSATLTVGGSSNRVSNKNVAQAWVSFSSSGGTVTVHDSHNVSGVSRSSAGKYRVSFTTSFSTSNYAWVGSCSPTAAGNVTTVIVDIAASGKQTGSIDIAALQNGAITDSDGVSVIIYGTLS